MNTAPQPMHLVCEITVEDAITGGLAVAGRFAHLLSSSDLKTLADLHLLEVARPFITLEPDANSPALRIRPIDVAAAATMKGGILPELQTRRAEQAAARAQAERDAEAIRRFLTTHGGPSHLARHVAGELPPDELHTLIREKVFDLAGAIREASRFRKLQVEDFQSLRRNQTCEATAGGRHGAVFETIAPVTLDPAEFDTVNMFRQSAAIATTKAAAELGMEGVAAKVITREHVMKCPYTGCTAVVRRKSAMVMFTWAGVTVGREYAL